MPPQISVIIPVYNAEKYLVRCLDSVLQQTFTDFEVLLINDGSTDSSQNICEEYAKIDSRIHVIHKRNEGVAVARQLGTDIAQGVYSIHCDSDDYIEADMLENMWNVAQKEQSDIVISNFYIKHKDGKEFISLQDPVYLNSKCLIKSILEMRIFGSLWNKLIRHSLYKEYNVVFINGLDYCEDVLVLAQILKYPQRISYLNRTFYHYSFENDQSITRNYTLRTFRLRCKFIDALSVILPDKEYETSRNIAALYVKLEANLRGILPLKDFNHYYPTNICTVWKTKRKLLSKLKYTMLILILKFKK